MSISRTGSVAAAATSGTFSATATGDLKVVCAYRSGSTTAPTLPSGWTTIASFATSSGGTTGAMRVGCNKSSSASDTGTGTWTNATDVFGASYAGTAVNATADCNTTGIGGAANNNAKASTTINYPAVTMQNAGQSWVAACAGDSAAVPGAPAGMTSVATVGAGPAVRVSDTNATATSWGSTNVTVTSSTWLTEVVEVLGGTLAAPTASPGGGFYSSTQSVTLSGPTVSGATIHYTTDNTAATCSSTLYSGAISVSASEHLRAVSCATGFTTSSEMDAAYTIRTSSTFSAASASYTDVNTAYTNSQRNDTINVPAGSVTWTSILTIAHGLTLTGAGVGSTVITASGITKLMHIGPDATAVANSENIKITGFTFDGNNTAVNIFTVQGAFSNGTLPYRYLLIGNNKFQNTSSGANNGCIYMNGEVRGVVYSNTFDRCDIVLKPLGQNTTLEWSNPVYNLFSFGSSDNFYFEGNTIQFSSAYTSADGAGGWIESGQGARVVVRFNTWNMVNLSNPAEYWDIHGFQNWNGTANSGQTGTMIVEYYGNTILSGGGYRLINHRGSWGIFFNNTFIGYTNPSIDVNQYYPGIPGGSGCAPEVYPLPTNYNPVVNNTYVFNNIINGALRGMTPGSVGNGCGIAQNANYWNQQTTFDGTAGIGYGLLAARPSTCTTGVGYWATDQGGWNNSGAGGQGVFYKCTSTNNWAQYYTPYTYPHPLAAGLNQPLPPTGIAVVVQ